MQEIILASSSPRRRELLEQIGVPFRVLRLDAPEVITRKKPDGIVRELSGQKASAADQLLGPLSGEEESRIILGADTIVWAGGQVLGKPGNEQKAKEMIGMLQGRAHEVYTGVTLLCRDRRYPGRVRTDTFFARTLVHVAAMTSEEIDAYVRTGDSLDKAGAYGIQGPFAAYIEGIEGDYCNVVGLPVNMVWQHLKQIREAQGEEYV